MRIGLATIHAGRPAHLSRQAAAVAELAGLSRYLVVAMDGTEPPQDAEVLHLRGADPDRLPLAAARNAAVAELADCDLIVLLDVDCIPDPGMLEAFGSAAGHVGSDHSILLGPVAWLSEAQSRRLSRADLIRARGTVIRDFPTTGVAREPRPELLWSLCCALSPRVHHRIGGFDEGFRGWGAEDTDLGRRATGAGIELWKVAGAWAYHQYHEPMRRTPAQIAALMANAKRFRARWGDWPAPDVLRDLDERGHIRWDPSSAHIELGDGVPQHHLG